MNQSRKRIYLDNAATSFPKPPSVYDAVDHFQRELGGAVGRGATQVGTKIQRTVDQCRNKAARLMGVPKPGSVIFTFNGTDSLNQAIHGLLKEGDRVVASPWEHNSVLRPLNQLQASLNVQTDFAQADESGQVDLDHLQELLKTKTRLVGVTHASNVTGVVQPIKEIVEMAHQSGALVLLDAAQTVGHMPVSMTELGVDFLACPGHKGLLGPLGTGILAIRPGLEGELNSTRQGGTGTTSELESQPESLPSKYESGNHNAPGLYGLSAAMDWLDERGVATIQNHEQDLTQLFLTGLSQLPKVQVYLSEVETFRVGVVSVNVEHLEPQTLCTLLDEHFGIETRAGLHCSPRAHESIGTKLLGGTVRFSFGPFNTPDDVDQTLEAIAQIASSV